MLLETDDINLNMLMLAILGKFHSNLHLLVKAIPASFYKSFLQLKKKNYLFFYLLAIELITNAFIIKILLAIGLRHGIAPFSTVADVSSNVVRDIIRVNDLLDNW